MAIISSMTGESTINFSKTMEVKIIYAGFYEGEKRLKIASLLFHYLHAFLETSLRTKSFRIQIRQLYRDDFLRINTNI